MKVLSKAPNKENWAKRRSVSLTESEALDVSNEVYTHLLVYGELYKITKRMIAFMRNMGEYYVLIVIDHKIPPPKTKSR